MKKIYRIWLINKYATDSGLWRVNYGEKGRQLGTREFDTKSNAQKFVNKLKQTHRKKYKIDFMYLED